MDVQTVRKFYPTIPASKLASNAARAGTISARDHLITGRTIEANEAVLHA
jgi:hypothetical protein